MCRIFLPLLYKHRGSRIINITSPCAETHLPMASVYGATKAGLDTISDSLRIEASGHGVNMVLLDPGEILSLTPFASRQGSHYKAMETELDGNQSKQEMNTFLKFSDVFSNHLPRPALGIIKEQNIYRSREEALFLNVHIYFTGFSKLPCAHEIPTEGTPQPPGKCGAMSGS